MNLYMAEAASCHDHSIIIGVFSTKSRAESALEGFKEKDPYYDTYEVLEIYLDVNVNHVASGF